MRRLSSFVIALSVFFVPLSTSALTQGEIEQIVQYLQSLQGSSSTPVTDNTVQVTVTSDTTGTQLGRPSYLGDLSQYGAPPEKKNQPILPLEAFLVKVSTSTVDENDPRVIALRKMIEQLTAILKDLLAIKAQRGSLSSASSLVSGTSTGAGLLTQAGDSCPALQYDMSVGSTDAATDYEVSILQNFLARDPSVYPDGLVSGYFGAVTKAAVIKWQSSHGVDATGFVGPITREAMTKSCAQ